jgi:hypothetical protein
MVGDPFFCLKIGRLKAEVRRVTHPSMQNLVFQVRPILLRLGFYFSDCGIAGKVPWHIGLWLRRYSNGRSTIARTANIRHLVYCANCQKSVAHFRAMVVRPLAYRSRSSSMCQLNRSRVKAKSARSGAPVLTSIMLYCTGRSFETGDS